MNIIKNVADLAAMYDTTPEHLDETVHEYTDYATQVEYDGESVTITTTANEYRETNSKTLRFPFSEEDWEDALSGLQCWADAVWCDERQKETDKMLKGIHAKTCIYTVTIIDRMCDGFEPWVATFSTRKQAQDFMDRIGDTLREHGVADQWLVSFDSQMLNSTEYLDWLNDYLDDNDE